MKRVLLAILFLVLIASPVGATSDVDTVSNLMQEVRWIVHCSNDDMLPDSVLIGFAQRALVWTSADIGGIEAIFLIETVAGTEFYAFPDTVTEILYGTFIDSNRTHSIKSFTPSFYEDAYDRQTTLDTGTGDQQPRAYNLWADSIQLMPSPIKVDSLWFKCFVEHPACSLATAPIILRSPYVEAAIEYTCMLVYKRWQEFDKAAYFQASYNAMKVNLVERYRKRMELMPQ